MDLMDRFDSFIRRPTLQGVSSNPPAVAKCHPRKVFGCTRLCNLPPDSLLDRSVKNTDVSCGGCHSRFLLAKVQFANFAISNRAKVRFECVLLPWLESIRFGQDLIGRAMKLAPLHSCR